VFPQRLGINLKIFGDLVLLDAIGREGFNDAALFVGRGE
jgi:hypothetical protein